MPLIDYEAVEDQIQRIRAMPKERRILSDIAPETKLTLEITVTDSQQFEAVVGMLFVDPNALPGIRFDSLGLEDRRRRDICAWLREQLEELEDGG